MKEGFVSAVGDTGTQRPGKILRDKGASQSLMSERILPRSERMATRAYG